MDECPACECPKIDYTQLIINNIPTIIMVLLVIIGGGAVYKFKDVLLRLFANNAIAQKILSFLPDKPTPDDKNDEVSIVVSDSKEVKKITEEDRDESLEYLAAKHIMSRKRGKSVV